MWHDTWLPDETIALRSEARAAVAEVVAPVARRIGQQTESAESFPWDAFRGLADAGLFAVPFDSRFGKGLAQPMLGTCTVTEEIAYQSSSMAGVYDGQCILVPQALSFATDELRARLLPALVSGSEAFSFATTEPNASSDLSVEALETVAEPVEGGFTVTGRKRWITNSVVASWAAVLCRTGNRMNMLMVDLKSSPGIRIGAPDLKMGHRGQLTADIIFDDVFVPQGNLLGEPGPACRWHCRASPVGA